MRSRSRPTLSSDATSPAETRSAEQQHTEDHPGQARKHHLMDKMLGEPVVHEYKTTEQREREYRKACAQRLEGGGFERFHGWQSRGLSERAVTSQTPIEQYHGHSEYDRGSA